MELAGVTILSKYNIFNLTDKCHQFVLVSMIFVYMCPFLPKLIQLQFSYNVCGVCLKAGTPLVSRNKVSYLIEAITRCANKNQCGSDFQHL